MRTLKNFNRIAPQTKRVTLGVISNNPSNIGWSGTGVVQYDLYTYYIEVPIEVTQFRLIEDPNSSSPTQGPAHGYIHFEDSNSTVLSIIERYSSAGVTELVYQDNPAPYVSVKPISYGQILPYYYSGTYIQSEPIIITIYDIVQTPTGLSYSQVTSDQNMAGKAYGPMCDGADDIWFSSGGSFNNSTYDISVFGSTYQSNTYYLKVFVFDHGTANLAMQPWCVDVSNLPGNPWDIYGFMGYYNSSGENNYMSTYYNGNRDLFVADLFSYRP